MHKDCLPASYWPTVAMLVAKGGRKVASHQASTNRQRAPQCDKVRQCAGDKGCQPVASRQAGIQRAGICGGSPKLGHPPPLWVTFQQTTPQDRPAGNSANVFMHCGSGFVRKFRSIRTREAVHRYAPVRAAGTQGTSVRVTRTPCCCNGPATVVERLGNGRATLLQRSRNAPELIASTACIHWSGVGFGAGAVPRKPRGFILETHTEPSRFVQPAHAETQAEPLRRNGCQR